MKKKDFELDALNHKFHIFIDNEIGPSADLTLISGDKKKMEMPLKLPCHRSRQGL